MTVSVKATIRLVRPTHIYSTAYIHFLHLNPVANTSILVVVPVRYDIDNHLFQNIKMLYENDLGDYLFIVAEKY